MELISLGDAKRLGRTHYFTGKPCKNDHIALRYVAKRECVACMRARAMRQQKSHSERYKAYQEKWKAENPEKCASYQRTYYDRHRHTRKASFERWREENRARARATTAKSRAARAAPAWLTDTDHDEILTLYNSAHLLTEQTGVQHDVDHIVPLNALHVSGLHVPWNLQILTHSDNRSKGNR